MWRINMILFRKPSLRKQPVTTPCSPPSLNRTRRRQLQRWVLRLHLHPHHLCLHLHPNRLHHHLPSPPTASKLIKRLCLFGCYAPLPFLSQPDETGWFLIFKHIWSQFKGCQCLPTFKLDEGKKIQLLSSTSLVSPNDHASSQPLWEFLSPTSRLFSWTWGGTWLLAERRARPSRWRSTRDSISLASSPDPSTCRRWTFERAPRPRDPLKVGCEPVSCHSPSKTWEWTRERVWWSETTSSTSRPM